MSINTDNLLPMLLQVALQRSHPSPLPSNYVLTLIAGPEDPIDLNDTTTATINTIASDVWGNGIEFAEWSTATLTDTSATQQPGSLVLTTGQTTGSAVLPTIDLGAQGAATGSALTISWLDSLPTTIVSDSVTVAFSASSGGPFSGTVTVTNGETVTPSGRYCQVTVALASTSTAQTPQFCHLRMFVKPPWFWGSGSWYAGAAPTDVAISDVSTSDNYVSG